MASATSDPLSGIVSREKELDCYSGLYSTRARVLEPADLEELRRIFAYAREAGRRVTLRAGGHSFDAQALGDDLVVSMMRFDAIEVFADEKRMRVGAGATWGAILAELQPLGLVPGVTVTTANATAGGTLSGDCLSRFSPAYGKEGNWIESFDLLTTEGELLVLRSAPRGSSAIGMDARGARVPRGHRRAWDTSAPLSRSRTACCRSVRLTAGSGCGRSSGNTRLSDASRRTSCRRRGGRTWRTPTQRIRPSSTPSPRLCDTRADGSQSALLFASAFTTTRDRRLMPLYRPHLAMRIVVEWLMRVRALSGPLWRFYFRFLFRDGEEYVDDLEGFTFFMDGNVRAKGVAKRFGVTLRMVQQTFVVPSDPGAAGGWDRAQDDLVEWLEYAHGFLLERKLTPTINDVLFLPKDSPFPFLLSASADLAGFAVSYAFETSNEDDIERVKEAFSDLADVLWEKFGGRVYLVKNVCAKQSNAGDDVRRQCDRVLPPQTRARSGRGLAERLPRAHVRRSPRAPCRPVQSRGAVSSNRHDPPRRVRCTTRCGQSETSSGRWW